MAQEKDLLEKLGISIKDEIESSLRASLLSSLKEGIKEEITKLSLDEQIETLEKMSSIKPIFKKNVENQESLEEKKEDIKAEENEEKEPEEKSEIQLISERIIKKLRNK